MTLCQPWADSYTEDICIPCESSDAFDPTIYDTYLQMASELVFLADGKKYPGLCTTTVRPCCDWWFLSNIYSSTPTFASEASRYRALGYFVGCGCHRRPAPCRCENMSAIELPDIPATSVESVTIDDDDGNPVNFTDYELDGQLLLRTDDLAWPSCGIEVTYTFGIDPPLMGKQAAAALACELWKLCDPDAFPGQTCALPRNIASLTRQGVQVLFDRITRNRPFPRFGIPQVDLYLDFSNPYGSTSPSSVMSPENFPRARRIP